MVNQLYRYVFLIIPNAKTRAFTSIVFTKIIFIIFFRFCFSVLASLVAVDREHARLALSLALSFLKRGPTPNQPLLDLLARVTTLIARQAGCPENPRKLLQSLLPGLIHDFLNNSLKFSVFPMQLMGYDSGNLAQFSKDFEQVLVPLLLLHSPTANTLEDLSSLLLKAKRQVVEDNCLPLAAFFFPGMAAEETNTALANKADLVALGNFVNRVLGDDFMKRITSHVPGIITATFLHVQDDKAMRETFGVDRQAAGQIMPPVLSAAVPKAVIDTLDVTFEEPVFDCIAKAKPYVLTQMVVDLTAGLAAESMDAQLQCLFSLHLWLESVFASKSGKIICVLPFIVQHLSSSLLSFIQKKENSLVAIRSALLVLHKLFVEMLPLSAHCLENCLLQVTSSLIAVVTRKEEKGGESDCAAMARQILELLLVDHVDKFPDQMDLIEDYPEGDDRFAQLAAARAQIRPSLGLKPFIKKFLHITDILSRSECANLLRLASSKLAASPGELASLLDTETGLVRQLVLRLLNISTSADATVSQLALRCLGEVGPVDLQSHILSVEVEGGPVDSSASAVAVSVLQHLIKFMSESTTEGMPRMAYEAIFNILGMTAAGRSLDLGLLGAHGAMLEPVRKSSKTGHKENLTPPSEIEFLAAIEEPDLWTSSGFDYETWLRTLVLSLLKALPENSVLGHLRPMCTASSSLCEKVLPFLIHELRKECSTGTLL